MFSFIYKRFTNSSTKKNIITRDNSCNVNYNDLINNNLKKSIIIYDNSVNFITKTPISSLDLNIPTHFKIYEILTDLDTIKCLNIQDCDNEYDIHHDKQSDDFYNNYYERSIIQNNIKIQNIKNFIYCCDTEELKNPYC